MKRKIKFNYSKCMSYITQNELDDLEPIINSAHQMLQAKTGRGSEFLGWVDIPIKYDKKEVERIKQAAAKIRGNSDAFVVIGIGGSYLGARAGLEMLNHSFNNILPKAKRNTPEIYFVGNNMSSTYISDLMDILEEKDISLNIISKSGTTTEPALAFRIFRELLEKKYGKDGARERIYATTDSSRGALKKLAQEEHYETFVIPDDVGGRFSVLTPVGLLPLAAGGLDIEAIMNGAESAYREYLDFDMAKNECCQYAAVRNALYKRGKTTEIMVNYEPGLHYFAEWWKQLFGESEGKEHKGIFPAAVDFTTDLHSMGQYIQDGLRNIFETVIHVETPRRDICINDDKDNIDGLNFLTGKTINDVNQKAFQATLLAHNDGGVPNMVLSLPYLDEFYFGSMVYFFEKACGISGYMLGVNPFDQPGVEEYKKNMFALLGKPGFEEQREVLQKRL